MWLARGNGFCHDLGKLPCAVDRPARSSRNNRSCNLFSKPFFAIASDDLLNLLFRSLRKPLGRGLPVAVDPSACRAVRRAETESSGAWSSWGEETPRSSNTPSTPAHVNLPPITTRPIRPNSDLDMHQAADRISSPRTRPLRDRDQLPSTFRLAQAAPNRAAMSATAIGRIHISPIWPDAQAPRRLRSAAPSCAVPRRGFARATRTSQGKVLHSR